MEFEEHEETELWISAAALSHDDFKIQPPTLDEERPVAAAVPMIPPPPTVVQNNGKGKYHECLKSHTVEIGGHTLDGCIEFLPVGKKGTLDALKCIVCNCHRNFHHKETPDGTYLVPYHHHPPPLLPPYSVYYRAPTGYVHMRGQQCSVLALNSTSGGGGGAQSTREDIEGVSDPTSGATIYGGSSKKCFRTRFTQKQKEKMLAFAEKLW